MVQVRVSDREYAKLSDLAKQLDSNFSAMGHEALLAMLPVWDQRARSLNPS